MIRRENKMPEQQSRHVDKNLEAILTSGKTAGEMLTELQKLMPTFDFEEVDAC